VISIYLEYKTDENEEHHDMYMDEEESDICLF
jgi:hypothetical protein